MKRELQEGQRYGRNKDTSINHAYINSGEYRKKFDVISNNNELNRKVYQLAKKMLEHRSGTVIAASNTYASKQYAAQHK